MKIFKFLLILISIIIIFSVKAIADQRNPRVIAGIINIHYANMPIKINGDLSIWNKSLATKLILSHPLFGSQMRGIFDKYHAKIEFQYDTKFLYAGIWWNTSLSIISKTGNSVLSRDRLILGFFLHRKLYCIECWRGKDNQNRAILAVGAVKLTDGQEIKTISQGYQIIGKHIYTQEIRIPWNILGIKPVTNKPLRILVELRFAGLNPQAGYNAFRRANKAGISVPANYGGAGMEFGMVDGVSSTDKLATLPSSYLSFNPFTGMIVKLKGKGAIAGPNPVVLVNDGGYITQRTRTTEIIATPCKNITITGELNPEEWDLKSGTTIAYEPNLLPGYSSVNVYWQYNKKGLYLGLDWHTKSKYLNVVNPKKNNDCWDGGDALQVRIGTDRASSVNIWCYNKDNYLKPAIDIQYGANLNEGYLPDALKKGARLAIVDTKGGGYTEEVFLPWALITKTGKPLKKGMQFHCILQLFFNGMDGHRIPFILNTKLVKPKSQIILPYKVSKNGYYTIAIVNSNGYIVRRLLTDEYLQKGESIYWNGLNDEGKPVSPGKYIFRGLYHTVPIRLKYLTTYNSPGNPPWQNLSGTGEWGGDESNAEAVATVNNGIYLAWPVAECGYSIIGTNLNGRKKWGYFGMPLALGHSGSCVLTAKGKYVYYADEVSNYNNNQQYHYYVDITCLNRKTGLPARFSLLRPYDIIAEDTVNLSNPARSQVKVNWWWRLWKKKDFTLGTDAIHDNYDFSERCIGGNLTGIAVNDGKLYVSLRVPGEILVFNDKTLSKITQWKIIKPAGLAFSPNGKLYAISNRSVVCVNLKTGKITPIITTNLQAPVDLTIGKNGNIYVSDWGKAQCVKVFNSKGKFIRIIGKYGGRPWVGKFNPDGMLMPRGITIDKNGKLWVTEDDYTPARISAWNSKTGKFLKEFIGSTWYGGNYGGPIEPNNPSLAMSAGVWYRINLKKEGYYKPLWTMWRRFSKNQYFNPGPWMGAGGVNYTSRIIQFDGKEFLTTMQNGQTLVIGELGKNGSWKPLVAFGGLLNRSWDTEILPDDKLGFFMSPVPGFFLKHAGEDFIWTNLDGSGKVRENEMQWAKTGWGKTNPGDLEVFDAGWGLGMLDNHMNVIIASGGQNGEKPEIVKFPFLGWTKNGLPKYNINKYKIILQPEKRFASFAIDSKGDIFTCMIVDGYSWGYNPALSAYAPDGKLMWCIPFSKTFQSRKNIGGSGIMGPIYAGKNVGEIIALANYHGSSYIPLITTDGLIIGQVLRNPANGGNPGPDMYRSETIPYIERLNDGRILLIDGANAHNVMQITGLNTISRFNGKFTITLQQILKSKKRYTIKKSLSPIRIMISPSHIKINGHLKGWDWATASNIGDSKHIPWGQIAMRISGKNFGQGDNVYIAFKVFKKGPFINTGSDYTKLFMTGDAVELDFSINPAANPTRKVPTIGDCRLLISKLNGKPVVVLYQAIVPGAKHPVIFDTSSRVVFDKVEILKNTKAVIRNTSYGYVVEARIPSDVFGGNLWPGRVFQGDAGIVVGDKMGHTIARVYRFNKTNTGVYDMSEEAMLNPDLWGKIDVETYKGYNGAGPY